MHEGKIAIQAKARLLQVGNGNPQESKFAAAMVDKPVQRASLKEKLAAFKAKAAETKKQEPNKEKWKDKTL